LTTEACNDIFCNNNYMLVERLLFTNYNWAPRSAAVYTARPTFSLFDICICSFQIGPNLKYYFIYICYLFISLF